MAKESTYPVTDRRRTRFILPRRLNLSRTFNKPICLSSHNSNLKAQIQKVKHFHEDSGISLIKGPTPRRDRSVIPCVGGKQCGWVENTERHPQPTAPAGGVPSLTSKHVNFLRTINDYQTGKHRNSDCTTVKGGDQSTETVEWRRKVFALKIAAGDHCWDQ